MKNENSVINALWEVQKSMVKLSSVWNENSENVNLNDLDSINLYPFDKDFDEMIHIFTNYVLTVESDLREKEGK